MLTFFPFELFPCQPLYPTPTFVLAHMHARALINLLVCLPVNTGNSLPSEGFIKQVFYNVNY